MASPKKQNGDGRKQHKQMSTLCMRLVQFTSCAMAPLPAAGTSRASSPAWISPLSTMALASIFRQRSCYEWADSSSFSQPSGHVDMDPCRCQGSLPTSRVSCFGFVECSFFCQGMRSTFRGSHNAGNKHTYRCIKCILMLFPHLNLLA
jgi:hypothetical protein